LDSSQSSSRRGASNHSGLSGPNPLTLRRLRTLARQQSIAGMGIALALNGGVEGSLFTWLPYFAV